VITSISSQNRIAKDTVQTYVQKFSSSANASDMNSAFADDKRLVMANKERMRNRRFSEGKKAGYHLILTPRTGENELA